MTTTRTTDNRRGILLITAAGFLLTLESVLVRLVGESASARQIVFARATAQLALATLWLTWSGQWHLVRTRHPSLHIARGLASLTCWMFYYVSFRLLDLATATTLTFTTQLLAVALAGPLLKERVGLRRGFLTAAGFTGVLLVTRVGSASFDPAVLYGIAAAVSGADHPAHPHRNDGLNDALYWTRHDDRFKHSAGVRVAAN